MTNKDAIPTLAIKSRQKYPQRDNTPDETYKFGGKLLGDRNFLIIAKFHCQKCVVRYQKNRWKICGNENKYAMIIQ
jgi:hypothetical protein